jgi:hypothetical protein
MRDRSGIATSLEDLLLAASVYAPTSPLEAQMRTPVPLPHTLSTRPRVLLSADLRADLDSFVLSPEAQTVSRLGGRGDTSSGWSTTSSTSCPVVVGGR